jgi:transglutaminase-like putative cysteine protease
VRIAIRHTTLYRYTEPLFRSVQYLRIKPRHSARQHLIDWTIEAPGTISSWADQHGNPCYTLVVDKPLEEIEVVARGTVETFDTSGVVPAREHALPLLLYLRQTAFTQPDDNLKRLAGRFREAIEADRVAGLHDLMIGVRDAVAYRENETHVHTTAAEALAEGVGVCQDHAHVFISVCRLSGVPVRYVGGYLATSDGAQEHAAGHAWAEAFVPSLGWVSFDPANGVSATEHYVRAAIGLDYASASPVRGVRQGGGQETMTVKIRLEAAAPSQQQTQQQAQQ